MRYVILVAVVSFLFCGCWFARVPDAADALELDPTSAAVVVVRLPEAAGSKALDKSLKYRIYLSVNDLGKVILAPEDQLRDNEGDVITTLDNPAQVLTFLKRRAAEDRTAMGSANKDRPLRSTVVLRVDKNCPFEKTYEILKAWRSADYTNLQWRATRGGDGEGQISIDGIGAIGKAEVKYVALVASNDTGKLSQLWLQGEGLAQEGLDLKADVEALAKTLTELATKNRDKHVALLLEIDERLLHADVIHLIDTAVRSGITDVRPVPIDKSKR